MREKAGSGFVVDDADQGLIVTPRGRHQIASGRTGRDEGLAVRIVLDDGTRGGREVLGYDSEDTVLRVDSAPLGLRALQIGRARAVRVGGPVAVIGTR